MSKEWYCRLPNGVSGPFSMEELQFLQQRGRLTAEDHLRRGAAGRWVRAKSIAGLFPDNPRRPPKTKSNTPPAEAPNEETAGSPSEANGDSADSATTPARAEAATATSTLPSPPPLTSPKTRRWRQILAGSGIGLALVLLLILLALLFRNFGDAGDPALAASGSDMRGDGAQDGQDESGYGGDTEGDGPGSGAQGSGPGRGTDGANSGNHPDAPKSRPTSEPSSPPESESGAPVDETGPEDAEPQPADDGDTTATETKLATVEQLENVAPRTGRRIAGSGATGGAGRSWEGLLKKLRQNGLDLMIVFDSTGSMGGEIVQLKAQIRRIAETLFELVPSARIGICTYRDHGDDYLAVGETPTKDIEDLSRFLADISAGGGGDGPEAVEEGLAWVVGNVKFRRRARKVILLFGDAPPHTKDVPRCRNLAAEFQHKQKGVVSTVTCRTRASLPEFVQIAESGGGEAYLTANEREIMTELMVLVFGSHHRRRVLEAFDMRDSRERSP